MAQFGFSSFAKLVIVGMLAKDVETKYTPSGKLVAQTSIAVNEQYKNANGETVKNTTWIRITAWEKDAEWLRDWAQKNTWVYMEGKLTADKTTGGPIVYTKQDGTSGSAFEITPLVMRILTGGKKKGDSDGPQQERQFAEPTGAQGQSVHELPPEDDIPF